MLAVVQLVDERLFRVEYDAIVVEVDVRTLLSSISVPFPRDLALLTNVTPDACLWLSSTLH